MTIKYWLFKNIFHRQNACSVQTVGTFTYHLLSPESLSHIHPGTIQSKYWRFDKEFIHILSLLYLFDCSYKGRWMEKSRGIVMKEIVSLLISNLYIRIQGNKTEILAYLVWIEDERWCRYGVINKYELKLKVDKKMKKVKSRFSPNSKLLHTGLLKRFCLPENTFSHLQE